MKISIPLLLKYFVICHILFMSFSVSADQVKLYLDNTRTKHIMVKQQDCSVHKTEDGRINLGFKVGTFLFGIGPEISFWKKNGIDWHHTIQGLIARYQELCAHFNTGSVTKEEYDKRLKKIETIEKEAYELYQIFLRKKAQSKQDIFDELDRETNSKQSIKKAYERINKELDIITLNE